MYTLENNPERILLFDFLYKPMQELNNGYFEIIIKSNNLQPLFDKKDYTIFLSNKIEYNISLKLNTESVLEESIKFPINCSYIEMKAFYSILNQILSHQSLKDQFKNNIDLAIKQEEMARKITFETRPEDWRKIEKMLAFRSFNLKTDHKLVFRFLKEVADFDSTGKMISEIGLDKYSFINNPEEVYNPDWGVKKKYK